MEKRLTTLRSITKSAITKYSSQANFGLNVPGMATQALAQYLILIKEGKKYPAKEY